MADCDVRICLACKTPSIEDDREWVDPQRCPRCGSLFDETVERPGPQVFHFVIPKDMPS